MMKTYVLASNNQHKIEEIKMIIEDINILTMSDIGFYDEIEETGSTALENALIKAKTLVTYLNKKNTPFTVLADDSG